MDRVAFLKQKEVSLKGDLSRSSGLQLSWDGPCSPPQYGQGSSPSGSVAQKVGEIAMPRHERTKMESLDIFVCALDEHPVWKM